YSTAASRAWRLGRSPGALKATHLDDVVLGFIGRLVAYGGGGDETQKDEIRSAPRDKVTLYQEAIFWHRLHAVKQACADLHNYVARCGSFFPSTLKDKCTKVSDELWSAVSAKAVGHEAKDARMQIEAWGRIQADTATSDEATEAG